MSVSSEQIAAEMGAKHWAQAEVMLNQVIAEHPNSAKAWYYLAETQANEGKMGPAEASLTKFKALAPNDTHFRADPNAVAKLEAFIATPHPVANLAAPHVTTTTVRQAPVYVAPRHHDSGVNALVSVLIIVAILACITGLIYGIVSIFRRRETVVYNNTYHDSGYGGGSCPVGYGAGPTVQTTRSYPGAPTVTAPAPVGGGTVVVQQPVPMGGMGPGYYGGGGLTGGGLLTDMMAINMMENMMDHNHGGYGGGYGGGQVVNETIVNNPAPSYDPSPAPSYEPDYGTSNGGSDWGDSSGGFDSGSSDFSSSSDW